MATTTYRTREGDMLDQLCWQHYGTQIGTVEAAIGANPGLADRGPIYPAGILITLPEVSGGALVVAPVRLWD